MIRISKCNCWLVTFKVDKYTDIEVAIVKTATSEVVRHLAAGVLGASPPAPLIQNSLQQTLIWDGRNDYGTQVTNFGELSVRVRVGTSVKLDKIAGGDPYGWFSFENDIGDHAAWSMKQAIDAKRDGSVFIYGNAGALGSPMIRQYDLTGNYIKTVFPFPAGLDIAAVEGWGIRVKSDGSYAPAFSSLQFEPTITDSYVASKNSAHTGTLIPNPHNARQLTVITDKYGNGYDGEMLSLQKFNTDGTIAPYSKSGRLIASPSLPSSDRIGGNIYTAYSNDGKYLYVSSLYDKFSYANPYNFYHEGQVFKVDVATRKATSFYNQGAVVTPLRTAQREIGFSQLHGVAVDRNSNVFVCDRQNSRIVVLSPQGNVLRQLPISDPDNVAVSASGIMYVTTRTTSIDTGDVYLHKFNNWMTDNVPSKSVFIAKIIARPGLTDVEVAEKNGVRRIWVTYPSAPVKIFSDGIAGLILEKDFSKLNTQKNLAINSIVVDSKTETLYVTDGFTRLFKIDDWKNPVFKRCMIAPYTTLSAGSVAIDERNRFLYVRSGSAASYAIGPIKRWNLDSVGYYTPVNSLAGSNIVTDNLSYFWSIGVGLADSGFDVAPDGSLAVTGDVGGIEYPSYLKYFDRDESRSPWGQITLDERAFFGAKTDLKGNIYAAHYDGPPTIIPPGYEADPFYQTDYWNRVMSRIYKFVPTGKAQSNNLYPYRPAGPVKIYDVAYGMTAPQQPSSFGVDGYGRIAYPTAISQTVSLMDNAGNEILNFGTYGNPDSKGGLLGELVPTMDIPLAYGHTVDISENYIYVGDINNNRILRILMRHALKVSLPLSQAPGC